MRSMGIALALSAAGAWAQPLVQIGKDKVTREEIQALLPECAQDPLLAIEAFKRKAWEKELARRKGLDAGRPKAALFRALFGVPYADEGLRANLPGVSISEQRKSALRLAVYDLWIQSLADKNLPVRILDQNALWEMVVQSPAYRIREEAGDAPSLERWEYQVGDLLADPAAVIATRGGKVFVDGSEYNEYLREAYGSIRLFAKRGRPLGEIRERIARTLAQRKLLGETAARGEVKLENRRVEAAIQGYVDENCMFEGLDLRNAEPESFPFMKAKAQDAFADDKGSGVSEMRQAWAGNPRKASSRLLRILGGVAEEDLRARLSSRLGKDEVFGWMRERAFPGGFGEAKEVLATERLDGELGDLLAKNKIDLPGSGNPGP